MLKIKYEAVAFPKSKYGKKLYGSHILNTDWHEIIWAAITVGKRNSSQITQHGVYSLYEIVNRSTLVWSSLKSSSGYLEKTGVYKEMDPTEKVFVSFSLGMTMSKLFALKLLNIPWLEHVANVNTSIKTRTATKSRPDLIGLNVRKEFVIVEAKGRTNGFSSDAQVKAKNQTKVINNIGGIRPVLRVASQCFFNDKLEVYIEDPEQVSENAIEVDTKVSSYLESYYGLFKHIDERELELLKPMGIEISFSKQLADSIKNNSFDEFEVKNNKINLDKNGFKCFPDGIKIKLDPDLWSDDILSLEPEYRQLVNT